MKHDDLHRNLLPPQFRPPPHYAAFLPQRRHNQNRRGYPLAMASRLWRFRPSLEISVHYRQNIHASQHPLKSFITDKCKYSLCNYLFLAHMASPLISPYYFYDKNLHSEKHRPFGFPTANYTYSVSCILKWLLVEIGCLFIVRAETIWTYLFSF